MEHDRHILFLEHAGADPFGTCRAEPASVGNCSEGKKASHEAVQGTPFGA